MVNYYNYRASELLISTSSDSRIKSDSNITSPFSSENNSSRNLNSIFNRIDKQAPFTNQLFDNKEIFNENNYCLKSNFPPINKVNNYNLYSDPKKQLFKVSNVQDNITSNLTKKVNSNYLKNHYSIIKQEESSIKNTLQYGSTLFDLKEFRKCSFVLKQYAKPSYQTAMFIYYLSEYNLIEQKKQEEMLDTTEIGAKSFNSRDYVRLQQSLEQHYQKDELDAFNLYLYAIILKELQLVDACRMALIKCLNLFPYLWSAWVELSLISKQSEMVNS